MVISDLNTGMVVFDTVGNKYFVIKGTSIGDVLYNKKLNAYIPLDVYNDNMECKNSKKYNINEVCVCDGPCSFMGNNTKLYKIWSRDNKNMSLEEKIKTLFKCDLFFFIDEISEPVGFNILGAKVMYIPSSMFKKIVKFIYGSVEEFIKGGI